MDQVAKAEIKKDLDLLPLNKAILSKLREAETELDIELEGEDMDLIESRFVGEPFRKIEKALHNFDFLPISHSELLALEKIFVEGQSKIITKELVTPEFLQIMPKMKKGTLLYQLSSIKEEEYKNEAGAPVTGTQIFH